MLHFSHFGKARKQHISNYCNEDRIRDYLGSLKLHNELSCIYSPHSEAAIFTTCHHVITCDTYHTCHLVQNEQHSCNDHIFAICYTFGEKLYLIQTIETFRSTLHCMLQLILTLILVYFSVSFFASVTTLNIIIVFFVHSIEQACAMYGLQAASNHRPSFIRPTRSSLNITESVSRATYELIYLSIIKEKINKTMSAYLLIKFRFFFIINK